jgi:hypothetical protein
MRALVHGVDTNTPGLYVLLWLWKWVAPIEPLWLRLFSVIWTIIAVVAAYALVRRRAPIIAAACAGLALWAHPLVLGQALEARFYAPMLAFVLLFALALDRRSRLSIALAAMLLCMSHYLGVIAWALLIAATVARDRRPWRRLWPALLGPATLLAWTPAFLIQRASVGGSSWVPPLHIRSALEFLSQTLPWPLVLIAIILLAWQAIRRHRNSLPPTAWLLLTPAALLLVSIIQPMTIGRYGIATAAGLAILIATAINALPRMATWLCILALLALSSVNLLRLARVQDEFAVHVAKIGVCADAVPNRLVLFTDPLDALPVYEVWDAQHRPQFKLIEPDPAGSKLGIGARTRFTWDIMRNYSHYYPGPAIISEQDARQLSSFYFVPAEDAQTTPQAVFPAHKMTAVNRWVYEVTR